ncbi:ras-related protein Rab-7L1-like [Lytechinus pictus]|uniref:ras-related protein Rab-7L1-like n=1 Tax=Lytechinus pictus TaxID=7653 RepID=UPI00240D3364|nr:ras-related protein Rab-7L1-like [Lytechinus pictus]
MDGANEVKEKLFKVIIVGDSLVGKTTFVHRYVSGKFDPGFKTTVGVDFALKKIERSKQDIVRLQLWDIAGQERVSSLTRVYYKDASACVIMFDVTQRKTFNSVMNWKNDVEKKVTLSNGTPVPCLLLANKIDLPSPDVREEEIKELCHKNNFIGWNKISVKDNTNIDQSMNFLVEEMLVQTSMARELSYAEGRIDSDGRIQVQSENKSRISCCS